MRKGLWSPDEDERLVRCITKYVNGSWSDIARKAGLDRCGKSCRRRWMNHLRPDLKRGKFSMEEIFLIIQLQETLGNRWSDIASHLEGRTDNDVKNLWNTQIKKRLAQLKSQMQSMNFNIDNLKQAAGSSTCTASADINLQAGIQLQSPGAVLSTMSNYNHPFRINGRQLLPEDYSTIISNNKSAEGMDESEYMMIKMEFPDAIIGPSTTTTSDQYDEEEPEISTTRADAVSDFNSSSYAAAAARVININRHAAAAAADHDHIQAGDQRSILTPKTDSSSNIGVNINATSADHHLRPAVGGPVEDALNNIGDYYSNCQNIIAQQKSSSANPGKELPIRTSNGDECLTYNYNDSWPPNSTSCSFNVNRLLRATPTCNYQFAGVAANNDTLMSSVNDHLPSVPSPITAFSPNSYDQKAPSHNSLHCIMNTNMYNQFPDQLQRQIPYSYSTTMSQMISFPQPDQLLVPSSSSSSSAAPASASAGAINMLPLAVAATSEPSSALGSYSHCIYDYKLPTSYYNAQATISLPPPLHSSFMVRSPSALTDSRLGINQLGNTNYNNHSTNVLQSHPEVVVDNNSCAAARQECNSQLINGAQYDNYMASKSLNVSSSSSQNHFCNFNVIGQQ